VPDPDHVVGPVGVGGDDYGRDRTKDAELRPEVKVGDTVIFGFYASPREVLADPTRPLRDE
jgi:co-chaperonin GroES (HSP10)